MTEETAAANALQTAHAELSAALDYTNGLARYEQARREQAEADAAALKLALSRLLLFVANGRVLSDVDRTLISDALIDDRPGAQLLAELNAARAVVEAAFGGGNYPTFALSAALSAYDEARKARG